jgi:arabinose-5-phosphate isomerase
VLQTEAEGILGLKKQLGEDFVALVKACDECLSRGGKIVVCGVGKSGHVGRKISATLASTGSPSVFMHPVEAMHGDLGMLQKDDLMLALSYSGESNELLSVILPAKRLGVPVAAFTCDKKTSLAQYCDISVPMHVQREACPFNLAPTTTSTAQLALGDSLAMTLLTLRKFTKEDYGRVHPSGAIGRAVTMRVSDVMRSGDKIALVSPDDSVKDCLLKITKARCGSAIVVDAEARLLGIFCDSDFRRHAEKDLAVLSKKVSEVMTPKPTSIKSGSLAVEILKIIEKRKIDDIIVVDDDGKVVGLVDIQDLPGLKLM